MIEHGKAPAAGLDLFAGRAMDFMNTIAAARREDQFLGDMTRDLGTSLDLNETLAHVETRLQEVIPHQAMVFFIRRANTLVSKFATGSNERVLSYLEIPVGQGMAGWVAETGHPVVNGNPAVDPGFSCEPDQPLESALAIPLDGARGPLGILALYHEKPDGFSHDQLRMLLAITPKIANAIENALKYREADERAKLDALTGLPNRQLLREMLDTELARARRLQQPLAVIHCSIAGLSQEMPQSSIDDILCALAANLKQDGREYDHIGRIGNNEFALVLPGMKADSLPVKLARLQVAAQKSRVTLRELPFAVGQAFYPEDGDGKGHLLLLAARRAEPITTKHTPDSLQALVRAIQPEDREQTSKSGVLN